MIPIRLQIQAIADRLAGLPVASVDPAELTPPWSLCWAVLDARRPTDGQRPSAGRLGSGGAWDAHMAILKALDGYADAEAVLEAILCATPGERIGYPSLKDQEPAFQELRWLWPAWIPRGLISLVGGEPGAGKSLFALDLVRRILGGLPWPNGAAMDVPPDARCLYVDTEGVPRLIRQRAASWQIDTGRLYLMLPVEGDLIDLTTATDRERLEEMLYLLRPELVVIDSLSAAHSRGENNVDDVRLLLAYLGRLAHHNECGVLLVHHLRKRNIIAPPDIAIDDLRGSTHIAAMARSILGISIDRDASLGTPNPVRRVTMVKSNLTEAQPPFGMVLKSTPDGVSIAYVPVPTHALTPTEIERCADWLAQVLQAEPAPVRAHTLIERATQAGFSRPTLYRARSRLAQHIRIIEVPGRSSSWSWVADASPTPHDEVGHGSQ